MIGISGDSAETQALFVKQKKLGFTLLSDEAGEVAKQFGVPTGPGGTFDLPVDEGRTRLILERGVTAKRWTFVIARDGTIAHKDTEVSTRDDAQRVLGGGWITEALRDEVAPAEAIA